ncbi:MAG TPA: ABC transporter permease, partial [Gaiellaceae bacterium]|nr:ABC transporter permease [Gaiellaceae bacterium]
MIKVALAGLLGRKLRTALTAFAIVLGVAMVAGTLTLTGSIDNAFNFIFSSVRQGSDAVITGKAAVDVQEGQGSFDPTVPHSLLDQVRGLSSVSVAEGSVNGTATLIGHNNKAIVFGG